MERFILFGLAALARALGVALSSYGDWLFQRVLDGADSVLDLANDLWDFGRALVASLAERLVGRGGRDVRVRDDYESSYYGHR